MSTKKQVPIGEWKFRIATKPKLTMFEEVGKTGAVVWARWFDPSRGKKGAPVTKTTAISIRYPVEHRRAGQIWPEREQEVIKLAQEWHDDLVAGREPGAIPAASVRDADKQDRAERTLRGGFDLYLSLDLGPYPMADDADRADVIRACEEAMAALSEDAKWAELIPIVAAQRIWRYVHRRFQQAADKETVPAVNNKRNKLRKDHGAESSNDGAPWARRVVQHFFAAANWLSARGHIPTGACARPDKWTKEFRTDWLKLTGRDLEAEVEGPRFSTEEAGRLLDALDDPTIDPRLQLNILFGGDSLRAGQVRRAMRSHLDLEAVGEFGKGRIRVLGKGKKKGSTVDLDTLVREAVDYAMEVGYLRELEASYRSGEIQDYALMPQGKFVGGATPVRTNKKYLRPISRRTLLDYFHRLEEVAEVTHVPKRGWYGLRRLWTDLGLDHVKTTRGREILSGHARGSKVAEQVYRTREDEAAIREAARGRTAIREGLMQGAVTALTALQAEAARVINGTPDAETLRAVLSLLGVTDPTSETEADDDEAA